jgi:tetratricopeptide (TPR) repeat protein
VHTLDGQAGAMTNRLRRSILAILALASAGCSVQDLVLKRVADAAAGEAGVFASESDVALAGAAIPAALKANEALLVRQPAHRGLLLSAARGFTQYAYAFVQLPADELEAADLQGAYRERQRALRLYRRARDYGLRGLRLDGAVQAEALRRSPAATLAAMQAADAELLYWTSAAWAAAVSIAKDDPAALAALPIVEAMAARAEALAPDLDHGALQVFLVSFETSRPGASAASLVKARERFRKAVRLSEGRQAAPFVAMAEAVAERHGAPAEFDDLLRTALAVDPDATPGWRLSNHIAQRRARWLSTQKDLFFPE